LASFVNDENVCHAQQKARPDVVMELVCKQWLASAEQRLGRKRQPNLAVLGCAPGQEFAA
jgi:hypothetical protein